LRELKGAMRLNRSKDMFVRVSTVSCYDLKVLTNVALSEQNVSIQACLQ